MKDAHLLIQAVKLVLKFLASNVPQKEPEPTVPPPTLRNSTERRMHLYNTACSFIGMDASPNDVAPDEYGCAESVSDIFRRAFDEELGGDVSTYRMWRAIKDDPRFTRVDDPEQGDIIISPTGYRARKTDVSNGHVGIMSSPSKIMSNSSATGTWEENYTLSRWRAYYEKRGGYPVYFVRII